MEEGRVSMFGAADAVVRGVGTEQTVWRTVLTNADDWVREGASGAPVHARAVLVQEEPPVAGGAVQRCGAKASHAGNITD